MVFVLRLPQGPISYVPSVLTTYMYVLHMTSVHAACVFVIPLSSHSCSWSSPSVEELHVSELIERWSLSVRSSRLYRGVGSTDTLIRRGGVRKRLCSSYYVSPLCLRSELANREHIGLGRMKLLRNRHLCSH